MKCPFCQSFMQAEVLLRPCLISFFCYHLSHPYLLSTLCFFSYLLAVFVFASGFMLFSYYQEMARGEGCCIS